LQLLARLSPSSIDLRLFNEHYVVKVNRKPQTAKNRKPQTASRKLHFNHWQPPESFAEFSWHRDDVEQLDMLQG